MELVVLKSALTATKGYTIFKANNFYRCIKVEGGYIVYGELFDEREFESLFEDAISKVIKDWVKIGLLTENGVRLSKTAFTKLADIHTYGSGRNKMYIWYFRVSKDCIYGFYPMRGTNMVERQNECYQWYLDILNGKYEPLDERDVCFGNCGIPLAYSRLRIQ
jgi:hypothetical protein